MTDNIEHLILDQFRAMGNQIASLQTEMHGEFADVKRRLETSIAGMRRDEAGQSDDIARQQAFIDGLVERIQRIERRLELHDDASS
jgi:hemerythrin-like domain-containing protein